MTKIVRRGTSIIEIVIAAALISIAVIAALSLMNQSQKQNTYARDLAIATKYASQGADWIRNERNRVGWATLYDVDDGTYCLNTLPTDFSSMEVGSCSDTSFIESTIFQREVIIVKDSDSINITIAITWLEQVERQTSIEMELTSWH
jgi:Tfp pilus assembly protein PilV